MDIDPTPGTALAALPSVAEPPAPLEPIFRSNNQLFTAIGPTSGADAPATISVGTDLSHPGSGGLDGDGSTHTAVISRVKGVRINSSKNAWLCRHRVLKYNV